MLLPHKKCIQHDLLVLCVLRPWPPPVCAGAVVNAAFGSIAEAAATHRRPASQRGRAWPPSPGRHLVASSATIVHLREVGRSQRRDCISTATWLHSVCSDSVTNMY